MADISSWLFHIGFSLGLPLYVPAYSFLFFFFLASFVNIYCFYLSKGKNLRLDAMAGTRKLKIHCEDFIKMKSNAIPKTNDWRLKDRVDIRRV